MSLKMMNQSESIIKRSNDAIHQAHSLLIFFLHHSTHRFRTSRKYTTFRRGLRRLICSFNPNTSCYWHVLTIHSLYLFNFSFMYCNFLYRPFFYSSLVNISINTALTRPTVSFGRQCLSHLVSEVW